MNFKDLFFKVSAKLKGFPNNKEVQMKSEKEVLLDKLLVGNPDTRCKLGAHKARAPEGYAVMRLEGCKDRPKEPIYYFVKYTGEASEPPKPRRQVFEWIKQNRAHHGE